MRGGGGVAGSASMQAGEVVKDRSHSLRREYEEGT